MCLSVLSNTFVEQKLIDRHVVANRVMGLPAAKEWKARS